jgi:hypothetical protein
MLGFYCAAWTIIICSNIAGRVSYTAIECKIGASRTPLHTSIELRHRLVADTIVKILRQSGAIPVRLCGESGGDAEDDGKGQNSRFDFFHTKLFLIF